MRLFPRKASSELIDIDHVLINPLPTDQCAQPRAIASQSRVTANKSNVFVELISTELFDQADYVEGKFNDQDLINPSTPVKLQSKLKKFLGMFGQRSDDKPELVFLETEDTGKKMRS
jgi:hypothetical protein